MIEIEQIVCPVDECTWRYVRIPPPVAPDTLAQVFGRGVMQAVALANEAEDAERAIREHMAGHTAEQFLRTITRLAAGRPEDLAEQLAVVRAERDEAVATVRDLVDNYAAHDQEAFEAAHARACRVLAASPTETPQEVSR